VQLSENVQHARRAAVTGKMVAALRAIGFKKVFDTDFGADITIIEEATELVKRLKENKNLPMITTCCPAWIKFGEQFFFEQLNHMSTCKSPQAIIASLVKSYFAEKLKINPKDIVLIDIMLVLQRSSRFAVLKLQVRQITSSRQLNLEN